MTTNFNQPQTALIKISLFFAMLLTTTCFFGCSTVKIYSDEAMQHPTAIKFHYAKPYVLVEKSANKDGSDKISIIYLPDLTETFYAKAMQASAVQILRSLLKTDPLPVSASAPIRKFPKALLPSKASSPTSTN